MRKGANRDSEMPLPSAILDPDRQDEEFEGFSVPGSILRVTLVDFMQVDMFKIGRTVGLDLNRHSLSSTPRCRSSRALTST